MLQSTVAFSERPKTVFSSAIEVTEHSISIGKEKPFTQSSLVPTSRLEAKDGAL